MNKIIYILIIHVNNKKNLFYDFKTKKERQEAINELKKRGVEYATTQMKR